jgi:hypothetical protein
MAEVASPSTQKRSRAQAFGDGSGSPFSDPRLRLALARAIVMDARTAPAQVARGNFGCIYAPAPACLDGSRLTYSPSAVGKVSALDDDYRTEAEVLARLERIDPEHRYHVRFYGACPTADLPDCPLEDEDGDEAGAEGDDPERPAPPRGLLVMERAEPLDPRTFPDERLPDALARLWDGLEAMAAAGIRYEDLHAGNLLVGEDGLWRMVDFGGCTLDADREETTRVHAREMRLLLEAAFGHSGIARRWAAWLADVEGSEWSGE